MGADGGDTPTTTATSAQSNRYRRRTRPNRYRPRLLAAVGDHVETEADRALVNSLSVAFAYFSGGPGVAVETGVTLSTSTASPLAAVWAAVPTAHALARAGRFGDATKIVNAGLHAATLTDCGPLRFALGFAEIVALMGLGDHAAVAKVPQRYAQMAAASAEGCAMVDAMAGMIHQSNGDLVAARSALQHAVAVLSRGYQPAWLVLTASWLAQVEGTRGDAVAATAALAVAERAFGPNAAVFEPDLELARAWERTAAGLPTAGQAHALRAAQLARRTGAWSVEMWALHTAVRMGDRTRAPRLVELSDVLTTPWARATASHARGLIEHDGDLLDAAADQFAAAGATALAADAAAQAAEEHLRRGQRSKQLASSARAQSLAERGGSHSPAIAATAAPLPLTGRQHEIATLAARGLTSREIAARLSVSVRTVDGHLGRIFNQLGIKHRAELADLLRRGEPAG